MFAPSHPWHNSCPPCKNTECPGGLVYAAEGAPCLRFTYVLTPAADGPLTAAAVSRFTARFRDAVDVRGDLYTTLLEQVPDTAIVGLGSPGKGIPYDDAANTNSVVLLESQAQSDADNDSTADVAVGVYVGIGIAAVVAALLVAAVTMKLRRRKTRQAAERAKKQVLDDSNLSEDSEAEAVNADAADAEVWLDEQQELSEEGARRAGEGSSSLAALGAASTVATRLSTGETEILMVEKQAWSQNTPVV